MEYCSPSNRIVLPYDKPQLIVLGVRYRKGLYLLSHECVQNAFGEHAVENVKPDNVEEFINEVPDMKGIEGFVIEFKDGLRVKLKTDEYVSLHHAKDSINSPRRLFEVVIHEASDDLRSLFVDDQQALDEISNMERFASNIYNHLVYVVETFYDENKHLERKEYAIKGQEDLNSIQFPLAMQKYVGRDVDYKGFILKKWKDYLTGYESLLKNIED